ncbi:hypothetical protein [Aeromonas rivipollensis]|uniref:hypothetical protein n=1 Tax=Aeromonas rivipollensis TaxID=948519 RepID=UPI0026F37142|nr:hypothetical protein [Aeromonas media]
MKRFNCTLSDKRGEFGECMEEHKEGAFVPFSEISGLAEQLADATRQCGVMAELLREAIGEVPQTQSFPSRCDAALAGKMPEKRITKPARVWGASFMPGIPEQTVIDAAYRYAEYESSLEDKEVGKINFDLLMAAVHKTVPEGWRLVPFNPTTDQWNGLARAIIFWMRSYPSNQHTPSTLVEFITSYGYTVPKWMEDESEFLAKNHVISKGTAATLIYKAMLADGPASQGGEPCAIEPPLSSPA